MAREHARVTPPSMGGQIVVLYQELRPGVAVVTAS